ncbi:MAG: DUF2726 domain-containing protein [Candidatus Saccharimonas sp.]
MTIFSLLVIFLIVVLVVVRKRRLERERKSLNDSPKAELPQRTGEPSEQKNSVQYANHEVKGHAVYQKYIDVKPTYSISEPNLPTKYKYTRQQYIMTERERRFYRKLHHVFGKFYLIFPQIHLNDLFAHDQIGQSWQGALSTIQRKSVDYVLCTTDFRIVLAIELDDSTHGSPKRQERDRMVNYIFQCTKLPLLRMRDVENLTDAQVHHMVMSAMFESQVPNNQKIQG